MQLLSPFFNFVLWVQNLKHKSKIQKIERFQLKFMLKQWCEVTQVKLKTTIKNEWTESEN